MVSDALPNGDVDDEKRDRRLEKDRTSTAGFSKRKVQGTSPRGDLRERQTIELFDGGRCQRHQSGRNRSGDDPNQRGNGESWARVENERVFFLFEVPDVVERFPTVIYDLG